MVQLPLKPGPFDVVQYLVARRFPMGALIPAGLDLPRGEVLQERQKAEQLRAEFQKCGPGRILEFLVQEWNEKPTADFVHHAKLSYWSLDEALALSFGKEPTSVSWNAVQPFAGRLAFASEFAKRREIIQRAQQMGQLWDQTIPAVFMAWASRMSFPMPEELVAAIKDLGIQIRDWKSAYDDKAKELSEAQAELQCVRAEQLKAGRENLANLKEIGERWGEVVKTKRNQSLV